MKSGSLALFVAFCREFASHDRRGMAENAALTLALTSLQGFGILLLVPLLAQVGVRSDAPTGPVGAIASLFFDRLHVPRSLAVVLGLYVAMVSARAWVERRLATLDARLPLEFGHRLRGDIHRALLGAEWRFLLAARRSDLAHVLTQEVQRAGTAALLLLKSLTAAALLVMYAAIALRMSLPAASLALALTGALAWLSRGRLAVARDTGAETTGRGHRFFAVVSGHLAGLAEIRSLGAERESSRCFEAETLGMNEVRIRFAEDQAGAKVWMTVGGAATLAGLLLFAVEVLRLPPATLLVLIYVLSRIVPQATQLQAFVMGLANALPGFEAADALLRSARAAAEPTGSSAIAAPEVAVRFERISFAHRQGHPTITDLSFTIPVRRTTAVVGPSGSGKTTAALLLMGMLMPDAGRILVDATELTPDRRRAWRRRIAYVPQETFLLNDTLRANLLWARPEADDVEIARALDLAAATDFVRELPDGLDTPMGERGARLSGGERQRIALARALLVQPDLLVLDEATNALDVESERRIFQALGALRGRFTIVLITHRASTLLHVDHVVHLRRGRIDGLDEDGESGGRAISAVPARMTS